MPCPQTLCRIWEMKKSTSMSFFPFYTRVCYNFVSTNKHHWYIEPSCLYPPSESPQTIDHKIVEKDEHQKPKSHTNNCITIISRWVASTVQLQGCAKGKKQKWLHLSESLLIIRHLNHLNCSTTRLWRRIATTLSLLLPLLAPKPIWNDVGMRY